MVDGEEESQQDDAGGGALYVVRLGESPEGDFVVCRPISLVSGSHRLPGTEQTVAELVDRQALQAGAVSVEDAPGLETLASAFQSGNDRIRN